MRMAGLFFPPHFRSMLVRSFSCLMREMGKLEKERRVNMEGVGRAETAEWSQSPEDSSAGLPIFSWALLNETWILLSNDLRVKESSLYVGNDLLSYLTAILLG